ncbi:MAG: MptD family putative ECF transporter S component [Lachnospiraceae bacterium]|nr:MptD family putative ECF transporter S component [Lachnospiraceae bacterium]
MNEKKLQARDFITIGIFTAILWVVQMVIMYLGFLSPLIIAGYAVLIPIVTGIPMMLYYARIEKFGMLTITSVIVAILLFVFGMGLAGAPICIAAGLIADFIAKSGNYKSRKKTILSYAVFSLWVIASYLPLVITADSYKASLLESGFEEQFVNTLFTLVTPVTYPVIIVICFVCGIIGALIGKAVAKKNFEKAGII